MRLSCGKMSVWCSGRSVGRCCPRQSLSLCCHRAVSVLSSAPCRATAARPDWGRQDGIHGLGACQGALVIPCSSAKPSPPAAHGAAGTGGRSPPRHQGVCKCRGRISSPASCQSHSNTPEPRGLATSALPTVPGSVLPCPGAALCAGGLGGSFTPTGRLNGSDSPSNHLRRHQAESKAEMPGAV